MNKMKAGILLHITSLPGKYGIGTIGEESYKFVDFLADSKIKLWQVLPLYPTGYGDSPYQANSSNARNYYLIDLDDLVNMGLISSEFLRDMPFKKGEKVDYEMQFKYKVLCLKEAYINYSPTRKFNEFVNSKKYHEYALYMTLKERFNFKPFNLWPGEYKNFNKEIEDKILINFKDTYLFYIFTQYIFNIQWRKLKEYANKKGIELIGDIPLYLGYDSADVYFHKELFQLDKEHKMTRVAGCPPDAFSSDGQLWGNPLYNWHYMAKDNYKWWHNRIKDEFQYFDYLRIDHFRGLDRYYSIPSGEDTARNGKWVNGPKIALFKDILDLKIIAEDLGEIDDSVRKLLKSSGYPGMKVLEFAFDGNINNEHKPSNFSSSNYVCYTGTHDNSPLKGYITSLSEYSRNILINDLVKELKLLKINTNIKSVDDLIDKIIELAFASKADICIIPWQDIMHLGEEARMNHPSTISLNNWSYMAKSTDFKLNISKKIKKLVEKYNR